MKKEISVGIVGIGNMGSMHANSMSKISGARLSALCDIDKKKVAAAAQQHGCTAYDDAKKLIASGDAELIIIATPHYFHTTIGIDALKAGLHVIVEKPISVHKADCERLIAAHKGKKQVFGAMFNQRTLPAHIKLKQLIDSGELGEISRVNWIITNWFRTETYYASGGWRATWAGEGGGVLLNQCPHNLDLLQWFCGMPTRVHGFCSLGKHHDIEVEDEVTAYLEYKNGATGLFVTSTGEAPGTNRLEICAEMGKVILENGTITFTRNTIGQKRFSKTTDLLFGKPDVWHVNIPVGGGGGPLSQHEKIIQNTVNTIRGSEKLIAPAPEGINSVELGNCMLYSSLTGKPVDLPLNGAAYERKLKKLIRESTFTKKVVKKQAGDMNSSF